MNAKMEELLLAVIELRERLARLEGERDLYKAMWQSADKRADTYAAGISDVCRTKGIAA